MGTAAQVSSNLRLVFYDGDDILTGKPVYKAKSFNNVKTTATAAELYAVADALATLQERPLYLIERRDNSEITKA